MKLQFQAAKNGRNNRPRGADVARRGRALAAANSVPKATAAPKTAATKSIFMFSSDTYSRSVANLDSFAPMGISEDGMIVVHPDYS